MCQTPYFDRTRYSHFAFYVLYIAVRSYRSEG